MSVFLVVVLFSCVPCVLLCVGLGSKYVVRAIDCCCLSFHVFGGLYYFRFNGSTLSRRVHWEATRWLRDWLWGEVENILACTSTNYCYIVGLQHQDIQEISSWTMFIAFSFRAPTSKYMVDSWLVYAYNDIWPCLSIEPLCTRTMKVFRARLIDWTKCQNNRLQSPCKALRCSLVSSYSAT